MKFRTKLLILSCMGMMILYLLVPCSTHSSFQVACCYTQCPVTGDCCVGQAFEPAGYCHFRCWMYFPLEGGWIPTADITCY